MGVERAAVTEQAKLSRPSREVETQLEHQRPPGAFTPHLQRRLAEGRASRVDLLYLQQTLGNRAVQRLTTARVQKQETDDPAPGTEAGPPTLDQMYRTALSSARQSGDWQNAAEKLNGFSHEDIQTRLAELTPQELVSMHAGAVANPRVGPDSNVARLTEAGVPPASTEGPKSSQGPAPAPAPTPGVTPAPQGKCPKPVTDMTNVEKLSCAIDFAREHRDAEMDEQLKAMQSTQFLFGVVAFGALYLGAQLTPVGWIADAFALTGLTLAAVFTGGLVFEVASNLGTFAGAVNATNEPELDVAGDALAKVVALGGATLLTAMVMHGAGKIPPGRTPFTPSMMDGFEGAVTADGQLVRVPAEAAKGGEPSQSTGGGQSPKEGAGGKAAEKTIPGSIGAQPTGEFVVEEAEARTGTHIWSRQTTAGKVLIMGDVEVTVGTVKVNDVHTQLEGTEGKSLKDTQNTVGPKQLLQGEADFARYLGKQYGVSRVEIYPATRTTPGFEGKVPRPRIYNIQ